MASFCRVLYWRIIYSDFDFSLSLWLGVKTISRDPESRSIAQEKWLDLEWQQ